MKGRGISSGVRPDRSGTAETVHSTSEGVHLENHDTVAHDELIVSRYGGDRPNAPVARSRIGLFM